MSMRRRIVIALLLVGLGLVGVAASLVVPRLRSSAEFAQTETEKEQILSSFNDMQSSANTADATAQTSDGAAWGTAMQGDWRTTPIKDKVNLDIQFIPQGPLDPGPAHWAIHAESCEEAASLMAHNYLASRTVTMQQAEDDIFALVDWQVEHFGDEHDIYSDEVKTMIEGFWGHTDVEVVRNVTPDDLKRLLSSGVPVIAPTIASYLHNPRYPEQGYHMVLIKGYTADRFIVHDNGTTWGADYPYPYADLMAGIRATGGDVVVIHS